MMRAGPARCTGLVALLWLLAIVPSRPRTALADNTRMLPTALAVDKTAHAAVSYGIALTGTVVLRRFDVERWQAVAIASAVALALGSFKELVLDDRYSWTDQAANGIGVATSAALSFTFQF